MIVFKKLPPNLLPSSFNKTEARAGEWEDVSGREGDALLGTEGELEEGRVGRKGIFWRTKLGRREEEGDEGGTNGMEEELRGRGEEMDESGR